MKNLGLCPANMQLSDTGFFNCSLSPKQFYGEKPIEIKTISCERFMKNLPCSFNEVYSNCGEQPCTITIKH